MLLYLDQMLPRLNHVIKQEDINVSGSGMDLLLKMAEGDMRRSLNILQASHMAYNKVDDEIVYKVNYYTDRIFVKWFYNSFDNFQNRLQEDQGKKI